MWAMAALVLSSSLAIAQSPETSPSQEGVAKKLDEINKKIDALSQQMLKIEQQISRPGVMIGESAPALTAPSPAAAVQNNGASHVVAKGETLTAIAKQHKVTVEDLQKYNHIEDGRKLQAGQTIMIPVVSTSPTPSPSASPSASQ